MASEAGGEPLAVYLDLVVILNFLVDFLLLMGTNRLAGYGYSPGRCAVAATLGGIYAGACMFHGFHFLGNTFWRICILCLIALYAFGWNKSAIKRTGLFLLLSMALGGAVMCFQRRDALALILGAGGIWLLCRIGFAGRAGGQEYVPLHLTYGGNTVNLTALRDSGNTLRDPVSGEEVFIIGADAAEKLTGLTREQLRNPLETLSSHPISGLRLIPFHAVNGGGVLLALRIHEVMVGNRVQSAIVAFSWEAIGRSGEYQALVTV